MNCRKESWIKKTGYEISLGREAVSNISVKIDQILIFKILIKLQIDGRLLLEFCFEVISYVPHYKLQDQPSCFENLDINKIIWSLSLKMLILFWEDISKLLEMEL